ncbi:uncharacterized protein EI90DRAFT_3036499 [Cantharellus anzutake]|uniref:uncharacterized protein n=1 Tax=Cantharellus anzutake TaxID=1750568 RepID=UPI00190483F1|nr:uncharacterized protein EI90DRAFT_3036499 [Cantharellus anzutake]KAF8340691.1 hypothetical protein EI90DRAFT_3036499 [Cantharellus anzutake]
MSISPDRSKEHERYRGANSVQDGASSRRSNSTGFVEKIGLLWKNRFSKKYVGDAHKQIKLADGSTITVYARGTEGHLKVTEKPQVEPHQTHNVMNNPPIRQRLRSLPSGRPSEQPPMFRSPSHSQQTDTGLESQPIPHAEATLQNFSRNQVSSVHRSPSNIKRKAAPRWSLFSSTDPSGQPQTIRGRSLSGVDSDEIQLPHFNYSEATNEHRKTFEPRTNHHSAAATSPPAARSRVSLQSTAAPTMTTFTRRTLMTPESSLLHVEDWHEEEPESPTARQRVSIHWTLLSLDAQYPIVMDLSKRKRDLALVTDPDTPWWNVNLLSKPATRPSVTKLKLVSPKTMSITIENDQGVTVHDVIMHLFETFRRPLTSEELDIFTPSMLYQARVAYSENRRHWTGNPAKIPNELRWIDTLFDEPMFAGLSCDPEILQQHSGDAMDTLTLVMNFKSR